MLKDNALHCLRNHRDPKIVHGYRAGIFKDETTQDPYADSVILRNISYLVNGYLLLNGRDEKFDTLLDDLVDEIEKLYP